jgi:hypothetical protein
MNSETLRRRSMSRRCSPIWKGYRPDWRVITEIGEERVYAWGGAWVHPCGETYQEDGKDGFNDGWGDEHCNCVLCCEFREEFCQ